MKLLDWLRTPYGGPPAREVKQSGTGVTFVGNPDWRTIVSLMPGAIDRDATRLTRATALVTSAYCWTAATFRATRLAEAPLMVVRETEDGEEWQPGHPMAALLEDPRPDLTMPEILARTQLYRDLTGGALWTVDRNVGGALALLTPFSAEEYRTEAEGALIYGRYFVRTAAGTWKPVPRDQVVHFRNVNPYSWRETVSLVDVALQQLDLGHTVNRIVHRYLERAMFPGAILSPDKDWHPTAEEWENWKEAVEAWTGGPANAGAPLTLAGGTTASKVAASLTDLLPGAVLDRVEATVGSVFGVPPVVLGWLTGLQNSPWSQMAEARRQAYEDTVEPLWRDVESRVGRTLLRPEERAAGLLVRFDTSRVRALMDDREMQARTAATMTMAWTVDELRVYTGQDPLPEGDPRGQEIPGLVAPAPADELGTGGDDDPDEDDDEEGDGGVGDGKADSRDLVWLLYDLEAKAAERTWERVVGSELSGLRAQAVRGARRLLAPLKAAGASRDSGSEFQLWFEGILEQSAPRFKAAVYPLALSTGSRAVRKAAARIGLAFDVLEPGLLKYASEEAAFLARVMGETTGRAVAKAVQDGLAGGETVNQLVKRLEQLPDFSRTRARLVARTETTRAWNGAQRRALADFQRRTGRKVRKMWLSARDARVRDEHADLDGQEKDVDEAFSNGLQQPGEPNCRCTLTYRVLEADGTETEVEETP